MGKKGKAFSYIYLAVCFLFLYLPIIVLIVFSFNDSRSRSVWAGFTLDWYVEVFKDSALLNSLWLTLLVAVVSAVVATIIGTAAAVGLSNFSKMPRNIVMGANQIPMLNPDIFVSDFDELKENTIMTIMGRYKNKKHTAK